MYFGTYKLRKTWLGKCLKSPVSEDPSTRNTLNGRKYCSKLNDSTFTDAIIPEKKIIFFFFFTCSKFRFNFRHFQKENDTHILCIFELTNSEKRRYINV